MDRETDQPDDRIDLAAALRRLGIIVAEAQQILGRIGVLEQRHPGGQSGQPGAALDPATCIHNHRRAIYNEYTEHRRHFTDEQWLAIEAFYRRGLSKTATACALGVSVKAVYDRLERSKNKLDEIHAEHRRERALFVARNLRESW